MTALALCLLVAPAPVESRPYPQLPPLDECLRVSQAYCELANRINVATWDADPESKRVLQAAWESADWYGNAWFLALRCQEGTDEPLRILREMELRAFIGDIAFENGWLPPPLYYGGEP